MKPAVVIIWFNPQNEKYDIEEKLSLYTSKFSMVFIVDNSNCNNSYLCEKYKNIDYSPLLKNEGIAKALNIGCEKALDSGFDWIMTMDQDSVWIEKNITEYLAFVEKILIQYNDVKSVAAKPELEHSRTYEVVRKIKKKRELNDYNFCDRCICSGNFIELAAWKKLGGFNEKLFIDEVDHEFCFRLREQNYRIVQSNIHSFSHKIGSGKKTFLPGLDKHNSFRLYYIARNRLYIMRKHPKYARKFHYGFYIFILILQKCIFDKNRIENINQIRKAVVESKLLG